MRRNETDNQTGPDFERFSQRYDIFSRSFWDSAIRSADSERFYDTYRKPLANWRSADGYTQRDYALRNAAWHVADIFAELKEDEDRREGYLDELTVLRDPAAKKASLAGPEATTAEIKRVARGFGADLVGVTAYDERWVYTHKYSRAIENEKPIELPDELSHVIVIAKEMDRELIDTVPSALSGTATGWGYSLDTLALLALAQYIRNLGYQAIPSLNDTALAIPLAIAAGLGEYGRHGLLITEEFGPRVRLGKVFTDLPLSNDEPRRFGVEAMCQVCRRCTDECPVNAITNDPPSTEVLTISNIKGVRKWSTDPERCFDFWTKQNTDCSICVRVCPYNRDFRRLSSRLWRRLAATRLRRLMLWIDGIVGHGRRVPAKHWWQRA